MAAFLRPLSKKEFKLLGSLILVVLLALPPLVNVFIFKANASSLSSYKVNIGDSRAGVATYHNFTFVTPSTTNIKSITFQYCTTPSGSCTAPSGMILAASPALGTVSGIGGSGYTPTSTSSNCTGSGNTNCTLTLTVTTPAAQTAGATVIVPFVTGVTNPTTVNTSYYARITTLDGSSVTIDGPNSAAFAILDTTSIAVSASVDPNFTFSVAAATSGSVNGDTITDSNTTATSIPFGTLTAGTGVVAAHDLTVTTNAGSGYTITASHSANAQTGNPPLTSGATNNIDTFNDSGASNASPATWSAPAGTTANSDTGYFGYTTNDATLCTGTANRFTNGGPKYAGTTTIGQEVACNSSAISSDTTRVGWKIQVNAVQPAGTYTGTVILIATPTY